jgi:hypothetical protein
LLLIPDRIIKKNQKKFELKNGKKKSPVDQVDFGIRFRIKSGLTRGV